MIFLTVSSVFTLWAFVYLLLCCFLEFVIHHIVCGNEDVLYCVAAETWPFIISLLTQCVTLEISSSKRRLPKLSFAKTLRIVVQRAEDAKFSG